MQTEQGWHATDCQPIVSRRSIRVRQIHKRSKTLGILVGATGFEPATPCAQGRCATRLRYAPTLNKYYCDSFRRARHGPADDEVGRWRLADVGHVVQLVRRLEDDPARPDAAGRAALEGFERTFLHDQQLLVLMLMRRVRRLAGLQRRDVDLELVEGRGRGAHVLDAGDPASE